MGAAVAMAVAAARRAGRRVTEEEWHLARVLGVFCGAVQWQYSGRRCHPLRCASPQHEITPSLLPCGRPQSPYLPAALPTCLTRLPADPRAWPSAARPRCRQTTRPTAWRRGAPSAVGLSPAVVSARAARRPQCAQRRRCRQRCEQPRSHCDGGAPAHCAASVDEMYANGEKGGLRVLV